MPQRPPVFHTGQRKPSGGEGALRRATAEIRQHVSTAGSLAPPAVKDIFNTIPEQIFVMIILYNT